MEFWGAVCHTGDVTGQNPFLHRRLWGRKHTNQQARGSGGNLEDPGGEGYDPERKKVVLIHPCKEMTSDGKSALQEHCIKQKISSFQRSHYSLPKN